MNKRTTTLSVAALASVLVAPTPALQRPDTPTAQEAPEIRCAEGVLAEPIGVGYGDRTRDCAIDDAGDRDRFVFFADAGDVVRVSVSTPTSVPIRLEVRDPFGIIAGRMTCRSSACEIDLDEVLPVIGDYEIVVFALRFSDTGAYTLKLERPRGPGVGEAGWSAVR